MKESNALSSKDLTKLGLYSSFLQASFNYERMQAGGFTLAMLPALNKIFHGDRQKISAAMNDNMEFINTHPNLVGFLMGLLLSLEENNEDRSLIKGIKVALFGPLAGIGDAIFWFTLLPIVAGISASFALQGSIIGPIIFFSVYLTVFCLRIVWTHLGYNLGTKALERLKDSSRIISKAATILGVTVIGGLVASYIHIEVLSQIAINAEHSVSIQKDFFNKIFPNILPMSYALFMLYFLKRKRISPSILILGTFIAAIFLSFLGVL